MQRLEILDEAADLNAKFPLESLSSQVLQSAMPWNYSKESPSVIFLNLIKIGNEAVDWNFNSRQNSKNRR